jgi:hypothetical protein
MVSHLFCTLVAPWLPLPSRIILARFQSIELPASGGLAHVLAQGVFVSLHAVFPSSFFRLDFLV